MVVFLWILISILFLLSIVGVFVPVIPDAILMWIAFLIYQFGIAAPGEGLGWVFWISITILTVLLFLADILSNIYFVQKYGGDKWSAGVAVVGLLLGAALLSPFVGPFSIILGPFLAVLLLEVMRSREKGQALQIAFGTLLGFLGSAFVKIAVIIIMIIWFVVQVNIG
ncbi:MAG TPA: DUF456 domain-containing protein [Paenibacillaceae bacterium]|nr:DUF456 domain-containing protein [Paenibacillaceae bacterium]